MNNYKKRGCWIGLFVGVIVAFFGARSYEACVLNPDPNCNPLLSAFGNLFALPLSVVQPMVHTAVNDQSKFITEGWVSYLIVSIIFVAVFSIIGYLLGRSVKK